MAGSDRPKIDRALDRLRSRFDTDAVPTCNPDDLVGQIDMAEAIGRCGSAEVGAGTGEGTLGTAIFNGCVLVFNGTPSEDRLRQQHV